MSEMTGKERIHAVIKGEPIDRIPFAINAWQWFYFHQYWDKLPPEYHDCNTALEFHKKLGADIITRWDGQIKGKSGLGQYVKFPNCNFIREEIGEPIKKPVITAFNNYESFIRIKTTLETPEGTLTQIWRFNEEICADFEEEQFLKDWDRDYPALKFIVSDRSYDFEMSEYQKDTTVLGDTGIVMIEIPENPVKMLMWLMGPQTATLALMDYPDECLQMMREHTELTLKFIDGVCERTTYEDCPFLMSNDNLDAALMPPMWFDMILYEHYQKVSQRISDYGRKFAVHSCGNNWDIRHCIKKSSIDMMEGLTPPNLGNFPLHLARQEFGDEFIVEGGMTCELQELKENARETIEGYTKTLFDQMKDTKRFIYASSCQTSPLTPTDNLHYFRDFCFKYGKRG